jgi:hypothetical protein
VDLDIQVRGPDVLVQTPPVILLDTNALIWLHRGDARLRRWRLATGDRAILDALAPGKHVEL